VLEIFDAVDRLEELANVGVAQPLGLACERPFLHLNQCLEYGWNCQLQRLARRGIGSRPGIVRLETLFGNMQDHRADRDADASARQQLKVGIGRELVRVQAVARKQVAPGLHEVERFAHSGEKAGQPWKSKQPECAGGSAQKVTSIDFRGSQLHHACSSLGRFQGQVTE
jgi:hypothetical protein